MKTGKQRMKELNKGTSSKTPKFLLPIKMWITYLVSLTTKDRGTIPNNIGNKILITNNMYITKHYLSEVIQIVDLSLKTPVTILGQCLMEQLRSKNCSAVVDFTVKNVKKNINLGDSGLKSRIRLWEHTVNFPRASERDKVRAERLLYTIQQVEENANLLDSRIFFTLRAKDGETLNQAEQIIYRYLASIGCTYRVISSNLDNTIKYTSLLSNIMWSKEIKSMPAIVNSEKTLSQMLPNTHALGDPKGIYMGVNMINGTKYYYDFSRITMGRNLYVLSGTGGGKTALVSNMCCSAAENEYKLCIMDIKGNEYDSLVDALGGATISLRETSYEYINTFKMIKEEAGVNPEIYFKNRINFSKQQMMILSGVVGDDIYTLEGFIDGFLEHFYTSLGVKHNNPNTWVNTLNLDPYIVYEALLKYINTAMRERYSDIMHYIFNNLKMYYAKEGSRSYIFSKELQYKDLLSRPAIRFDFGLLSNSSTYDVTIFQLKFQYMRIINDEYVTYNYNHGYNTFKVLEEAQVVNDSVLEAYAKEYTLRRAQNQTTVLIGNSIMALSHNKVAQPIIENTTGLLLGKLNKVTLKEVVETFDLQGKADILLRMSHSNEYLRHFVFINSMETKPLVPILKVPYDTSIKYKLLTPTREGES